MLLADALFDTTTYAHRIIFSASEPVWSTLGKLKDYMDSYPYPGWDTETDSRWDSACRTSSSP